MHPNNANVNIPNMWNRFPVLFRALLTGFLVSTFGVAIWSAVVRFIPLPYSILAMTVPLWLYWKYFSGTLGRRRFAENRQQRFRLLTLTPRVWKLGLACALLFVAIVQSSFVLSFRLIEMPTGYTSGYSLIERLPHWLAWSVIIMSSVVAGICEETGFRGYMQVPLEKKYGPTKAILVVAIAFTLIHLTKIWAAPIVPNIFFASLLLGLLAYKTGSLIPGIIGHSLLDIFDYSFWWTNLMGKWQRPTIFKSGLDLHFIFWCLIFSGSVVAFFWLIGKLQHTRRGKTHFRLKPAG